MSKLILEHAQKSLIDSVLLLPLSYRQKSEKLHREHGISVSFKTLQNYHLQFLGGAVADADDDAANPPNTSDDDDTPEIDLKAVAELEAKIKNAPQAKVLELLNDEIAGVFALQLHLTKDALKRHAEGRRRYPADYIRYLQVLAGLLKK